MAYQGQEILNPLTGQRMRFVELNDGLLRIESDHPPTDVREPLHLHPRQLSGAEVLSGSLVFEVDGVQSELESGDEISIPANTPHRFWNPAGDPATSIQFFRPALEIAAFFETLFTLAERGDLTKDGRPGLLQMAVMVPEFGEERRARVSPPTSRCALSRSSRANQGPEPRCAVP